jgi:hypothetical protein
MHNAHFLSLLIAAINIPVSIAGLYGDNLYIGNYCIIYPGIVLIEVWADTIVNYMRNTFE